MPQEIHADTLDRASDEYFRKRIVGSAAEFIIRVLGELQHITPVGFVYVDAQRDGVFFYLHAHILRYKFGSEEDVEILEIFPLRRHLLMVVGRSDELNAVIFQAEFVAAYQKVCFTFVDYRHFVERMKMKPIVECALMLGIAVPYPIVTPAEKFIGRENVA